MAMISRDDIDAIRAQSDLADVVSHYVSVEKKGKDYVALCPFHADHDPSMRISNSKGFYKCFACGAGGDVFTFLQKMEGLTFQESVRKAAQMIHYPLPEDQEPAKPADPRQPLFDAMDLYTRYCAYELTSPDGTAAMQYLQQRKFDKALLAKFSIGYAPASSMSTGYMLGQGIREKDLVETNIARWQDNGLHAVFYNRIMIPIADPQGRIVGFTARCLPGSGEDAKYINTSQTPLYEKGRLIFNYHRARHAARKSGRVILVEGAMDVLGLEKAGIEEGLACLGTAITQDQIRLLAQLKVPVNVFYDSDSAGQSAVWKFGNLALKAGIPFSVVSQKEAKDPDEIFCSQGADALKAVLRKTISFAAFAFDYLQTLYDLHNYEDRKTYYSLMQNLIETSLEPFERGVWQQKLAEVTGFSMTPSFDQSAAVQSGYPEISPSDQMEGPNPASGNSLFAGTGKNRRPKPRYRTDGKESMKEMPIPGRKQAEMLVLWAMLYRPEYAVRFEQDLGALSLGPAQTLYLYIKAAYRSVREIDLPALRDVIEEPDVQDLLFEVANLPDQAHCIEGQYVGSVHTLKMMMLDEQLNRTERELAKAVSENESDAIFSLMMRKAELGQKRKALIAERNDKVHQTRQ